MFLKLREIRDGLHPSEVVATIATEDGHERVTLSRRSVEDGWLGVEFPIRMEIAYALVDIGRECGTGASRLWVPIADLAWQRPAKAA